MRVVHSNKAYPPHIGGIETVVQQLAEGMAAEHGIASSVVACSEDARTRFETSNGVSIIRAATVARVSSLPISPSYGIQLMRQCGDILHLHEPSLIGATAYLANMRRARRHFKRLVIWWHSDIVRQRGLAPVYTPLLRAILKEADAICVATPHHITSSSFLMDVAKKCRVIHFGIEPRRFVLTPDMRRRVAEIHALYVRPIVLFSGRLVYYKGVEYLIDAMRKVPNGHLVIVGTGPLLDDLKAATNGCANRVTFLPFLSDTDFVAMHHAADVFVLPSVENSEAFGIVQIEAMACGKPVISTDLKTGVSYVNQDGVTGLVVPVRDSIALSCAINTLIERPELGLRLGETARKRVMSEFTVGGMVAKTVNLYKELLHEE